MNRKSYPCQLLYDLRNTTAWISGEKLHSLFGELVGEASPSGKKHFNTEDLTVLDPKAVELLKGEKYAVAYALCDWKILNDDVNLSFLQAFDLRNELSVKRDWSFIINGTAATILSNQTFYRKGKSNDRVIGFDDGTMFIDGIPLMMCRWQ